MPPPLRPVEGLDPDELELPQPAATPNQAVSTPPAGDALTTKSSLTNIVRYNRLYRTPAITPSKCKEVYVSLRTISGVQAYASKLWTCMYAAWAVPLKAAGAAYKIKPKLSVHSGTKINTGCGVLYNTKEIVLLPLVLCGYVWYAEAVSLENLLYLVGGLVVLYAFFVEYYVSALTGAVKE